MRFFADIDSHRTPADTAPAAHTAAAVELVMPTAQLVCQPLAITSSRIGANGQAMDIAMPLCKTGIPFTHMFAAGTVQLRLLVLCMAKAGGTHHGAVAAGQAALRHLLPAGMLEIGKQGIAQITTRQRAGLFLHRMPVLLLDRTPLRFAGRRQGQSIENGGAGGTSGAG